MSAASSAMPASSPSGTLLRSRISDFEQWRIVTVHELQDYLRTYRFLGLLGVVTLISQLRGLQVTARTSVMQYKKAPKPVDHVGAELGATSVQEGSVRKAGDQLRIAVQLFDVGSQAHTWSNTFDRKSGDISAVQTEVAKRIAHG